MLTLGCIAHHEAGHVVIAHQTGFKIERASIRGNSDQLGATYVIQPIAPTREQARQIALILLGGYAADCFAKDTHRELSRDDFDRARRLLIAERVATRESVDAVLAGLSTEAVGIIAAHRRDIEMIYDLLVRRDELAGHEIENLLGRSG